MTRHLRTRTLAAGALALAAAGLVGCSDPITAPTPAHADEPSLAAGGLAISSARTLSLLPGAISQYAIAADANDLGQIVGASSSETFAVPVVWNAAGVPTQLPPLAPGQSAQASAISDDGTTVVGYAYDGATYQATRWIRSFASWAPYALPMLGGFDLCVANETNADGSLIVGYCYSSLSAYSAAVVWRSGLPQQLGAGNAVGVNESGQVVGSSSNGQAVLWTLTSGSPTVGVQSLGTLGGLTASPQAINEPGDVVGFSELANGGGSHAFLWTGQKGMVDLGGLGSFSAALDVNDGNQAVGYAYTPGGALHAMLWAKGKLLDIGVPLGYTQSVANAITNSGMIVGYVSNAGSTQAVVWQLR